jgi:hypothetical protein
MLSELIVPPVLLLKVPPRIEMTFPLRNCPRARSVGAAVEPKLYVSPAVPEPVPAVYTVFAPAPDSENPQPAGVFPGKVPVPDETRESKFCVTGVPKVEILTCVVVSADASRENLSKVSELKRPAIAIKRKRFRRDRPNTRIVRVG